jgi:hypothetical protein
MANSNGQTGTNVGSYDSVSVTPRAKQVRRINDDWAYINSSDVSPYATNDEKFNASYQTKGLQPQGLNNNGKNKKDPNDETANPTVATPENISRLRRMAQLATKNKAAKTATKVAFRARVSAVNTSIFAWGSYLWLVQLLFAVISLSMLGIMGVTSAIIKESGVIGGTAVWLAEKLAEGVRFVSGIDVNLAAIAEGMFIAPYVLVIAIGIITILAAYLQYALSFIKPLSGEMGGLKLGTLLLALIGYSVPLLNIFPWALIWMAVVWKYPR